ncbi:hypothetical protein [Pseudomonas putida]|uniref:hypothetical protein n=1 Tax=Pseudomonas putida TaxID=303 RepID=UPI00036E2191|nr:hypothetical protein [Pseudomonas putida]
MSQKIPRYEHQEHFGGSRILSTLITGPHTKRATPTAESYKYFKASVSVSTSDGHLIPDAKSKAEFATEDLEAVKADALAKAKWLATTTI